MKRLIPVLLLLLVFAVPASAQMRGTWTVGAGIGKVKTTASELKSRPTFQPMFGRLPSDGWGFAFAFNWFSADVLGTFVGVDEKIGRLRTRPLMFGVGYTASRGDFSVTPSVVAGPSFNTFKIDDRWDDTFSVEASGFEERIGAVSFAARPGVNVTYAFTSRLGVTGFGGYIFNRPSFTVNRPNGEQIETTWKSDGIVGSAGLIFSF